MQNPSFQLHIKKSIQICEDCIKQGGGHQVLVDHSALAARLTNRLLNALTKEVDNSDDVGLRGSVGNAGSRLKSTIAPFVENSRAVASSPADSGLMTAWRMASAKLLEAVAQAAALFDDSCVNGQFMPATV